MWQYKSILQYGMYGACVINYNGKKSLAQELRQKSDILERM